MQVFKRIGKRFKHLNGQNLVEFVLVFPMLIIITISIFEVALLWQDINTIYSINTEINAKAALLNINDMEPGKVCPVAEQARQIIEKKAPIVSALDVTFPQDADHKEVLDGAKINVKDSSGNVTTSQEPFALYEYKSNVSTNVSGVTKPVATLWVDCRNPFENGITTQVEFYHKTLIMHLAIPNFQTGQSIEVIPKNIYIASPKLNTLRHY
jgi:Flp pilus assembly protein TadG